MIWKFSALDKFEDKQKSSEIHSGESTLIGPSAQIVWPTVSQEILDVDVGGGFRGILITSGFFLDLVSIWKN